MKQSLSTSIDFYLQKQKTNPFHIHINSNSSSLDLINLRNNAYILNKLSLLNLEHPSLQIQQSFVQKYLQLYVLSLQAVIVNPLMPYRDYQSVKDLVFHIENFYHLLQKLTFISKDQDENTHRLKKKLSINSFWPRIRSLFLKIQQKIPKNRQNIRQYVTIRRGLKQPDKDYFLSHMMAKKVETKQLKSLIKRYTIQTSNKGQSNQNLQEQQSEEKGEKNYESFLNKNDWFNIKKNVRMIPLTDSINDWISLKQFLHSPQYKSMDNEQQKKEICQYLKDILQYYLQVILKISIRQINLNLDKGLKDILFQNYKRKQNSSAKQQEIDIKASILSLVFQLNK